MCLRFQNLALFFASIFLSFSFDILPFKRTKVWLHSCVRSRLCLPYLPYLRSITFSFQRSQRPTCSFIPFFKATWVQIKRQPSANSPKTRPGNQILWRASLLASSECHGVRVRVEYQQDSSKEIILNNKECRRLFPVSSIWKWQSLSKLDIVCIFCILDNLVLCGILNCYGLVVWR